MIWLRVKIRKFVYKYDFVLKIFFYDVYDNLYDLGVLYLVFELINWLFLYCYDKVGKKMVIYKVCLFFL